MTISQIVKEIIIDKFWKIYANTNKLSGICPPDCYKCEDRENLLLIPYEEEFIRDNLMLSYGFRKDEYGYSCEKAGSPCTMLDCNGKCKIYPFRPLDCRSFPIVPRFSLENNSEIDFFVVNNYCPLVEKISSNFIFIYTTTLSWLSIVKYLPTSWKALYNQQNEHNYIKLVPKELYSNILFISRHL